MTAETPPGPGPNPAPLAAAAVTAPAMAPVMVPPAAQVTAQVAAPAIASAVGPMAAEQPPAITEPGMPVPGLVICRRLGQGRSSQEALVRDAVTQRLWVLKEYLPKALAQRRGGGVEARAPDAKASFELGRAAFINEALWLTGVRHPALRRVHRVWQAQGTAFALLAPVEGTTLLPYLAGLPRQQQVPEEQWLVTFIRDLASALQVMHRAGRLHRGVHPGEVIVTPSGRAVLLGLSTMQLRRADGSPLFPDALRDGFAAPEQYGQASPQPQGPWTDLYALAAIAYGLMTGVALEPAPQRAAASWGTAAARLAPLSRLPAGRFNAQLVQGIVRTLALAPSRRPQTVSEFLATTGLTPRRAETNVQPLQFLFDMPRTEHAQEPEAVALDLDLDAPAPATEPALRLEEAATEVAAAADAADKRTMSIRTGAASNAPAGWLDPTLLDV